MTKKGYYDVASRTAKPLVTLPSAVGKQPVKKAQEISSSIVKISKRKAIDDEPVENAQENSTSIAKTSKINAVDEGDDESDEEEDGAAWFDRVYPRKKSTGHAEKVLPVSQGRNRSLTISSSEEEYEDEEDSGSKSSELIHEDEDYIDEVDASDLEEEATENDKVHIRFPFKNKSHSGN